MLVIKLLQKSTKRLIVNEAQNSNKFIYICIQKDY